ncbi:MAG: hypothetical protein AB7S38_16900 [Vulcanimicrobiota bacterium]
MKLALACIPAQASQALVLDLTNLDLDPFTLQFVCQRLKASPPPPQAQVFIHWVDGSGRHAQWQLEPQSPAPSLADDPGLTPAHDAAGGLWLQKYPQGRLWASFDPSGPLSVGRWRFEGDLPPNLPRGSLSLQTLEFFGQDDELVGVLDVAALARYNPQLVDELQTEFARWGLDFKQDLLSLLAGEVGFSLARRPEQLAEVKEMPLQVVALLSDPSGAERLAARLLPAVVSTSLPTYYREGVAIRQSLDQEFAFALVSDVVLFGINLGADGLGQAISARIAETSLADQPASKALRQALSPADGCLLAVVEKVGPVRVYAAGGPGRGHLEGPLVLEWIAPPSQRDAR